MHEDGRAIRQIKVGFSPVAYYNIVMDNLILTLEKLFSPELTTFVAALFPVIEVNGAVPLGLSLGISPLNTYILSVMGSIFPMPFLFFGIRPIFRYLMKRPFFDRHLGRLMERTLSKSDNIRRFKFWGLLIFIAIPGPGTGVWTGTLAAVLLDMRFKSAFPALLFGDMLAGASILAISLGAFTLIGL